MFEEHSVSVNVGGREMTLETGKLARQAHGSVLVSYGDTRVLVTAVSAKEAREGQSFFPLTVEFQEKFYSSGKIPGGFLKREGRPSNDATLSARMIDRPIRPLFPEGYLNDTQIVATVMSLDTEADVDVAAAAGVSAALHISDIPFSGPTAACRVGRDKDGKLIVCPTWHQIQDGETDMEILVSGTKHGITMVEGGAEEATEEEVLAAVMKGHEVIKDICKAVDELRSKCGREKREFTPHKVQDQIHTSVKEVAGAKVEQALTTKDKAERYGLISETKKATIEALVTEEKKSQDPEGAALYQKDVETAYEDLVYDMMRSQILDKKVRIDGRDTTTVRPIKTEVDLLPRVHGSSLFTRGETQVLAAVTLGTPDDEQLIDSIYERGNRRFMLHYNFPPFSVGEAGRMGGQSRREIGHGALAQRAVEAMVPSAEEFPYTIRIVCETLESNGSSSMGSVCSASMAMMAAGVPVKKPVAGIAMGLIKEDDRVAVLSDILGDEDHLGDMDFKVAGTKDGITGIQMDIKIDSVTEEIMKTALAQAKEGRLHILGKMAEAIENAQDDVSEYAPRITSIKIPVDKIGIVIGPSGKQIKEIVAETGCKVNIEDDGTVKIASTDPVAAQRAIDWVKGLVAEVEIGTTYKGTVKRVVDFGAFVEVMPNQDGLLHVSELDHRRVEKVTDVVNEGDELEVKVIDIDPSGKIRLSRKILIEDTRSEEEKQADAERRAARSNRGPRDRDGGGRGGRGGRGGDRGGRGGRGGGRNDRGGDRGDRGGDRPQS